MPSIANYFQASANRSKYRTNLFIFFELIGHIYIYMYIYIVLINLYFCILETRVVQADFLRRNAEQKASLQCQLSMVV